MSIFTVVYLPFSQIINYLIANTNPYCIYTCPVHALHTVSCRVHTYEDNIIINLKVYNSMKSTKIDNNEYKNL